MRKPFRLSSRLWILLVLPSPFPLHSQKPGQPYVSPLKNFTVPVPNFLWHEGPEVH